jgi:hypothetical protein
MARVGKMLIQTEQQEGRYDWVVRARPDTWLKEPLPVNDLPVRKITVPKNDYYSYTDKTGRRVYTCSDKLAIGTSVDMQLYLNKFKSLRVFCEQNEIHGEAYCAWHMAGGRFLYDGEEAQLPFYRHSNIDVELCEDAHHNCDRPGRLGCSTL